MPASPSLLLCVSFQSSRFAGQQMIDLVTALLPCLSDHSGSLPTIATPRSSTCNSGPRLDAQVTTSPHSPVVTSHQVDCRRARINQTTLTIQPTRWTTSLPASRPAGQPASQLIAARCSLIYHQSGLPCPRPWYLKAKRQPRHSTNQIRYNRHRQSVSSSSLCRLHNT